MISDGGRRNFLDNLAMFDGRATNAALSDQLGIPMDVYNMYKDDLADSGCIRKLRMRGGGVELIRNPFGPIEEFE